MAIDSGSGVVPISVNLTSTNEYTYWAKSGDKYLTAPWFYAIFIGV